MIFYYLQVLAMFWRHEGGSNEQQQPKRAQVCDFFSHFCVFLYTKHFFCYLQVLSTFIQQEKNSGAWWRPKWAQMTPGVSFWAQVCNFFSLFRVFLYTNWFFLLSTGSIYVYTEREGFRCPVMTKMGPNDSRCIVWALGAFFFSISCFFAY